MDIVSSKKRSWVMSQVHSENTRPEMMVRTFLHSHGFRFRLHVKSLPGHPDIVLAKYKTVIEVRGCFWHHHEGCRKAVLPASNTEYWKTKFAYNIERDHRTEMALATLGWNLIVIWECELKNPCFLETLPKKIINLGGMK